MGQDVVGRDGHFVAASVDDLSPDIWQIVDELGGQRGVFLYDVEDGLGHRAIAVIDMLDGRRAESQLRSPLLNGVADGLPASAPLQR